MGKVEANLQLEKAGERLGEAKVLLDAGYLAGSISSSYHAALAALQSALLDKEILEATFGGVIQQFNKHFIQNSVLPGAIKTIPVELQNMNLEATDNLNSGLDKKAATSAFEMANSFYTEIKKYLDAKYKAG
jgi:uncharacterized protein (UPF0332 family)